MSIIEKTDCALILDHHLLRDLKYEERFGRLYKKYGKKISFGITTNGTLLDNDKIAFLKQHNIAVVLSFDGLPECQKYRKFPNGRNSHDIVATAVKKLATNKINFTVAMSVTPQCVDKLFANVLHTINLGAKNIALNKVVDSYKTYTAEQFQILEEELYKVADFLLKYPEYNINFISKLANANANEKKSRYTCGAAQKSLGADIYGNFYPCHRLLYSEFKLGSIYEGLNWNLVSKWRQLDSMTCHKCGLYSCSICYATNYVRTGDILKIPPEYCIFEKIVHRVADYLRMKRQKAKIVNVFVRK